MNTLNFFDRFFKAAVTCKGCGGKIRFPLNKGTIRVVCPHCRTWFIFSPRPVVVLDFLRRKARNILSRGAAARPSAAGYNPRGRDESIKKIMIFIFFLGAVLVLLINVCDRRKEAEPSPEYPGNVRLVPAEKQLIFYVS